MQTNLPSQSGLLTPEEARKYLRVSQSTLCRLVASSRLAVVRISPRVHRFQHQELERFITESMKERRQ